MHAACTYCMNQKVRARVEYEPLLADAVFGRLMFGPEPVNIYALRIAFDRHKSHLSTN